MRKVTFDNSKGYGVHKKQYVTEVITTHSYIDEWENVQVSVHGDSACCSLNSQYIVT